MDDVSSTSERCLLCGRPEPTTGNRVGRGCAMVVFALIGFIVCTPLLWVARVAAEWALGI